MAAKKHKPRNARARKGDKRSKPQRFRRRRRRASALGQGAARKAVKRQSLEDSMDVHKRALQTAMSTIIVSIAALRRQNGDIDADVALVLERAAADCLDVELERVRKCQEAANAQ